MHEPHSVRRSSPDETRDLRADHYPLNQDSVITPKGGLVTQAYATGRVTATVELSGGLVATDTLSEIEKSYWDAEATGQDRALGTRTSSMLYAAGKLRTAEMQGAAAERNMADFDFADTWKTVEGPDGYPALQWQGRGTGRSGGSGGGGGGSGAGAYAGQDGIVQTDELRAAISDWVGGKIDTRQLRTVISAWVQQTSI